MKNSGIGRVLIVGAGPTGLTLALELARRGLQPTVIDAKEAPSLLSRAVGLTPRSLDILDRSGSAADLIAEARPLDAMHIYRGAEPAFSFRLHTDRMAHRTIHCLPQHRTEAILLDRLTALGTTVAFGRRLAGLSGSGPAIARFDDGAEARFDLIVGADGIASTVRQSARIGFPGHDLPEAWSIADVTAPDWRHPDAITVSVRPGRIAVAVPLGPARYRLVANTQDALAAQSLPVAATEVHHRETVRISIRQARAYSAGAVALAGDAAHTHSPIGGRGMNTGIADAAALADCLARGRLADYGPMRRPVGRAAIRETEIARRLMTGQTGLWRGAFSTMMGFGDLAGPLRRRIGRYAVEF